jgi:hypothetical protein
MNSIRSNPGLGLPSGTDVVFLALHGTYGEDGTVQKQLDGLGVPYTGCDAEASRIAFDKVLTKQACLEARCADRQVSDGEFARRPVSGGLSPAAGRPSPAAGFERGFAIHRAVVRTGPARWPNR